MIKCESTIVPVGAQSVIKILYYESMMVNYDFTSVISGPKYMYRVRESTLY